MKAQHSHSLVLVWRVAEAEAKRLHAQELQPDHLLLGLFKVVDLDLPSILPKDVPDRDEILEEFLREVRRLRTVFRTAQVNPAALRRRLRGDIPQGRLLVPDSERLHRSNASKVVFADAEHFAQLADSAVFPVHLLYAVLIDPAQTGQEAFRKLKIDAKRLQDVAHREILPAGETVLQRGKRRTSWN